MASDRELLELAAKAAGYDGVRPAMFGTDCWMALVEGEWQPWNPLTEDGDALRLAVKLGIAIQLHPQWVYARAVAPNDPYDWREITEGWGNGGDPLAATRLAIVRAAAALGEKP